MRYTVTCSVTTPSVQRRAEQTLFGDTSCAKPSNPTARLTEFEQTRIVL